MAKLDSPLTIEDSCGNTYLILPNSLAASKVESTSSNLKSEDISSQELSSVHRLMTGKITDKSPISVLLQDLNNLLKHKINFNYVTIYKLESVVHICSDDSNSNAYNSIEDLQNTVDDNDSNITTHSIGSLMENMGDNDHTNTQTSITEINTTTETYSNTNHFENFGKRFCFLTCVNVLNCNYDNYFVLVDDTLSAFPGETKKLFRKTNHIDKLALEHYLLTIENETNTKIVYKSIKQNIGIPNILYRKIVIYYKNDNSIHFAFYFMKQSLPDMLRNSVFYMELPDFDDSEEREATRNTLKYATINYLNETFSDINDRKTIPKV